MIMKSRILLAAALLILATTAWSAGINYDGTTLQMNNDFTRTECGTMAKKVMKEVSGMACSRQTQGYIWVHGDENTDNDKKIIAISPSGSLAMTVNIAGDQGRDDWEDIATGSFEGKNYVFIGAVGDNDLAFKDAYYIYYFEEPEITSGTITANVKYIRFGYPDNKAHNTETLMYDNIEHVLYIVDKVEGGACTLYSLPFRTDYGTGVQKLTEVCKLGNGQKFDLVTGGDITPDGQWMAIKNYNYILLWERQGGESLSETAKRLPQQIAAYEEEAQGESLAWADATTFYTTSDQKKDVPIYQYKRASDPTKAILTGITINGKKLEEFSVEKLSYDVVLAYGTTTPPVVAATAANDAVVYISQATSLPGTATVECISRDGSKKVVYTINFTVSDTPSNDATLKSLSINGQIVEGFSSAKYEYTYEIAYIDALPIITAEPNEEHASVQINNVTEVTKTGTNATIVVTAQDGSTTLTYTITFNRADAIKKLNELIMSNKYNAYIPDNDASRIQAYYLAGTQEPTIESYKVSEGAALTQEGNVVTLTGADGTTISYTLSVESVEPVEFTTDEFIFDGSESWVKAAYGFDSTKKWKFSKTDTDYSREIAGRTHVEFFLPACDTVILKSMDSKERAVRIFVNGVEVGEKFTLLIAGSEIIVNQAEPFMLSVVSAQSSGDGGVKALQMKGQTHKIQTAIRPTNETKDNNVRKVIRDGRLYIIKDNKTYTPQGSLVR